MFYSPYHDSHLAPCDAHRMLGSSIGMGPKGDPGHSIGVSVVPGDPYGYYRIQFKDATTDQVLITTPNLDPGSRIYLCDKNFNISNNNVYSANITDFTSEQLGTIRDARVGDLVVFKYKDEHFIDMFGVGVINSISQIGVVTFRSHINIGPGEIRESLSQYLNQQISILRSEINAYLRQMKQEDQQEINNLATEVRETTNNLTTEVREVTNNLANEVQDMSDEVRDQLASFIAGIFFGLTQDGYLVAYIPDSWNSIIFDTGADYTLDTYGRLILRMNVSGSNHDVVDQTPEIVRPYSDADLERKVYNIMMTLYEAGEPNGN